MLEALSGFFATAFGFVLIIVIAIAILYIGGGLFVFIIRFRMGLVGVAIIIASFYGIQDKIYDVGTGLFGVLIGAVFILINVNEIRREGF